jgi:hypothetical protein
MQNAYVGIARRSSTSAAESRCSRRLANHLMRFVPAVGAAYCTAQKTGCHFVYARLWLRLICIK